MACSCPPWGWVGSELAVDAEPLERLVYGFADGGGEGVAEDVEVAAVGADVISDGAAAELPAASRCET